MLLDRPGRQVDLLSRALQSAMASTDISKVPQFGVNFETVLWFRIRFPNTGPDLGRHVNVG